VAAMFAHDTPIDAEAFFADLDAFADQGLPGE
jgi:hypothetical protein